MADQKLTDRTELTNTNSLDEIHVVRHNRSYRMNVGLLQTRNDTIGNAIISGGVTWLGGLNYYVWADKYVINSVVYESPVSGTVTLSDGDATNDRFDVFLIRLGINFQNTVEVVEGNPDINPLIPSINLLTEVEVSFRLVAVNEITDPITTIDLVYDENVEWANVLLTTGGDLDNTSDPYIGTKSFLTPSTLNDVVSWRNVPINYDYSDNLIFALKTLIGVNSKLQIKLINSVSGNYWLKTLLNSNLRDFGFDTRISSWQLLNINLSQFAGNSRSETQFDTVEITFIDTNELNLDWINIQSNLPQNNNNTLPYRVMSGNISQTGNNNPVVLLGYNNTGLTPNFIRSGIGIYDWDMSNFGYDISKLYFNVQGSNTSTTVSVTYNSNIIRIKTTVLLTDAPGDGGLTNAFFEFKIYI